MLINVPNSAHPALIDPCSGLSLLGTLDDLPKIDRNTAQPLRLPVAEKYKVWCVEGLKTMKRGW